MFYSIAQFAMRAGAMINLVLKYVDGVFSISLVLRNISPKNSVGILIHPADLAAKI